MNQKRYIVELSESEKKAIGQCTGVDPFERWPVELVEVPDGYEDRLAIAMSLLARVHEQAGNGAPDHRRHLLTPGLRDEIQDVVAENTEAA